MTPAKERKLAALSYPEFLETLYWKMLGRYVRLLHGGRCDRCGRASRLQVHHLTYDHVGAEYRHPDDLAVLCDECHAAAHNKARVNHMPNLYDFNRDGLREGQRKAIDVIFERCRAREPYTAIVIPTRYGKSDLMRVSAVQLCKHGLIGLAFGLSPATQLTDQLDDHQKWIECIERYDLPRTTAHRVVEHLENDYSPNGECFRCATLQFVVSNVKHFAALASKAKAAGKPILFFIDECHFTSDDNRWGECAEILANAGALIVLLTATAIREDGHPPKGFPFERRVINADATRTFPGGPGSTPDMVKMDVYKGQDVETFIRAHHETTFAQAWAEHPSVLCKVTFSAFDVYLSDTDVTPDSDDSEDWMDAHIKDMSARQTRQYLGRICRSPIVISEGAERLVRLLNELRRIDPTVAAMVFCDCDRDDKGNFIVDRWAKNIRRAIEKASGGTLNVVIATSAGDEASGAKGSELIKKFQKGSGDVLIVKQMGGAGLHCPRIKIILDLSPVRALASWIQRIMRAATPHNRLLHCILITPADCLAEACFERMIASQGGAARFEGDLDHSYEVPHEEREWMQVAGVGNADFRDNIGNLGPAEQYEDVRSVRELFPELHTLTDPEIAVRVGPLADRIRTRKGRVVNVEREIEDLHKACNDLAAEIALHRMGGHYQPDQYPRVIARVWQDVHRRVGIDTIKDVTDLKVLRDVQAALIEILRSETAAA
jgi:hypothetical protein